LSDLFYDKEIDCVVVATPHKSLAEIAMSLLRNGKNVLLEKPGAINSRELRVVSEMAKSKNLKVHVGFNHEFHPSLIKLFEMVLQNEIGDLMYIRSRYGHGGRLGYESEWRAKKEISGGGELIDQGSHLIEIALRLLGNLSLEYAYTPTYFWKMDVEDNAFMVLKNDAGNIAFLHASCTEWKNRFSLEVYGTLGKLEISGLGRSHVVETLTHYRMLPEMGPPTTSVMHFDASDESWALELNQFLSDIEKGTSASDNVDLSIRVLEIVEDIYGRTGR